MYSASVSKNILGSIEDMDVYHSKVIAGRVKKAKTPAGVQAVLEYVDEILDGFGIEAIPGPYVDRRYGNINALYVNLGDTYDVTILYDTLKKKFYVVSWGDWVETVERSGRKMD
jgi:hypothetical protein